MSVKTVDPKNIILTVGGHIISGYADGTFISVERAEDAYAESVGADGEVVRVRSHNRLTALTVTLQQTSESNSVLSTIAQLDERANAGVVPVLLKEIDGDTVIASGKAWIKKFANVEYSKEITNREWTFTLAEGEMFVGGNLVSGLLGL